MIRKGQQVTRRYAQSNFDDSEGSTSHQTLRTNIFWWLGRVNKSPDVTHKAILMIRKRQQVTRRYAQSDFDDSEWSTSHQTLRTKLFWWYLSDGVDVRQIPRSSAQRSRIVKTNTLFVFVYNIDHFSRGWICSFGWPYFWCRRGPRRCPFLEFLWKLKCDAIIKLTQESVLV